MDRREVVRLLSGALVVPMLSAYSTEELLALGRRLNARITERVPGPNLFDPHQRATVTAIAERIIPETDTPGAGAAGVPGFIELIVAEHYNEDERARFLAGLTEVDARSRAASGRAFIETRPAEQNRILSALQDEAEPALAEKQAPFWGQIKFLTIYGYYTSEIGVTRELHSVMIPGRYDPCVAAGVRAPGGN
jgi:hypothetical protein